MPDNIALDAELSANESVADGVADMKLLASYLEARGVNGIVSFYLSLTRRHIGLIYEIVLGSISRPV